MRARSAEAAREQPQQAARRVQAAHDVGHRDAPHQGPGGPPGRRVGLIVPGALGEVEVRSRLLRSAEYSSSERQGDPGDVPMECRIVHPTPEGVGGTYDLSTHTRRHSWICLA